MALTVGLVPVKIQNPRASLNTEYLVEREHLGIELKCSVSMTLWHLQSQSKIPIFYE